MARLNPGHLLGSLVPRSRDQRVFLMAELINVYGTGLIVTALMLYAVKVVHLTPARAGLAFTIAALTGLMANVPMGRLADRRGPREAFQLALLILAAANAGFVFLAHSFVSFLIVGIADAAGLSSSGTASIALARRVGGSDAVTLRSQVTAVLNLGMSLGIATCGIAIQLNTVTAYRALFLGNAVCTLAGAVVLGLLPRYEPLPGAREESPLAALKDKAFVAYTALSGAMNIQGLIFAVLMPVWVVFHTNAPRWTASAMVIINTIIVFLFQVRIGNRVQTIRQGGAAFRRAGVIFLVSCSAMGLATGLSAWAAFLLLAAAAMVHTSGELWASSGAFALEFGLAPPHAQGQYQALVSMGDFGGIALAPAILMGLVLSGGRLGFALLGAAFTLVGVAGPVVARWGERTRPPAPAPVLAEQTTATD